MPTRAKFHIGTAPSAILSAAVEPEGTDPEAVFREAVQRYPEGPTALLRYLLAARHEFDTTAQHAGDAIFQLELAPGDLALSLTADYTVSPPRIIDGPTGPGEHQGLTTPADTFAAGDEDDIWVVVPGPTCERPVGIGRAGSLVASFRRDEPDREGMARRIVDALNSHSCLVEMLGRWGIPALKFLGEKQPGASKFWKPHTAHVQALLAVRGLVHSQIHTCGDLRNSRAAMRAASMKIGSNPEFDPPLWHVACEQQGAPIAVLEAERMVLDLLRHGPEQMKTAYQIVSALNAYPFLARAARMSALPALDHMAKHAARRTDRTEYATRANIMRAALH